LNGAVLLAGALKSGGEVLTFVNALRVCKGHGKVGCITNNAPIGKGASMTQDDKKAAELAEVFALFDHLIESSKLGIRKPDPRIYTMMLEALSVKPERAVYLDDLGINLKPAKALGMTTIKVVTGDDAIAELERHLGIKLG
jgi:putative hydrolase of the HAD superfamily